jgi:putative ABC transport system permease protein
MLHDLRYSLRMMRLHPWFSVALVAALALGIGANTAVFTLVNAVLFKPLPFPGGERIVAIFHRNAAQGQERVPISYSDYLDYREQASSFESLEASINTGVTVSDEGNPPEPYRMARVTPGFFDMLGVQPAVGRRFTPADAAAGADPVILLSHSVWRDRYGRSPEVVGRTVRAGSELATIIGVAPEGFGFPNAQQVWMPLVDAPDLRDRSQRNLMLIGKHSRDVSREQARADLDVIAQRLAAEHPDNEGLGATTVLTFHELQNGGDIRIVFILMQGAVGFVLLVACANVANMMLSRALGRAREMSVRAAMGASRWRMMRQPLVEAVVLSIVGGAIGLSIARLAVQAFETAVANVAKPSWILFEMDYRVFIYVAAVCVVSALLFGLVPGLQASRVDVNAALKEGSRDSGSKRGGMLSGALVVFQFMLAVVLLAGAGLFVRGLLEQRASLDGLPATEILSAGIQLPQDVYPDDASRFRFYDQLLTNLEGTPGLRQAAVASNLPASGGATLAYHLEGAPEVEQGARPTAVRVAISPGYLELLEVPILLGRYFDDRDGFDGQDSIIVTSDFASRVWPGESALGKRLRVYSEQSPPNVAGASADPPRPGRWLTVVGISADLKQDPEELRPLPVFFTPYAPGGYPWMTIVLRSSGDPTALAAPLRAAVRQVDGDRGLTNVRTLEEASYEQGWYLRVFGSMFLIFAAAALLLASIGIYAVVAQTTARRTQEIGVRMAMGATSPTIQRLVVGRGFKQLAVGSALGLAIAFAVTRLMGELLYGVSPTDPVVFSSVVAIIMLVGLAACWLPARRAARLDPLKALRHE